MERADKNQILIRERRAAQTHEIKGTRLDTRKENKKLNTDISAAAQRSAARAKSEAVGAAGVGGESSFRSKICSNC